MDLLYANDKTGRYPDSWYASTVNLPDAAPPLRGETHADVCVVGGGYTGLSAALHLAEAGMDVVLLEAHRAGFGASGRNGGQLGSGQRVDQMSLEALVGREDARRCWALGEEAKALVKDLIARHGIDCYLRPGVAEAASSEKGVRELAHYAAHMAEHYDYPHIETFAAEDWHALCPSPAYRGGILDHDAAHLHPLRFALGLAEVCRHAGVRIFETSRVHHVEDRTPALVQTDSGRVTADHVVLAANGYLGGLSGDVAQRVMPINNFIVATEPLGADAAKVLGRDVAVADDRFVVNYFRLSHDQRLLFGGGESYGYRFPADIRAVVSKPMLQVFPHLKDVRLTHAWGGTLAITMKRLPYLARPGKRILSASGYSGHGVGTATHAGRLMAQAIQGETQGFDAMAALPTPRFPGRGALRTPLLALAMSWYALRDRIGL
ncbi:Gamma-glutamylputrescine oxidoreductase [Roseivivax sp. THAF40]|uniref:NAD(P)/FAD-dependent oxidoreductase n=1 Tax=unclassified Roseivivax TaxID=2639302 RepID=UPI001268684C|nr:MULTISPECIES: FAD-binding oxidoreductase [unclassified Roseivivax]QFS81974.1 Gamma-glutamylputrescine oxidoreductase [Roseivivax sp. THAF197b]QFT45774.1 Gamma-glutamylputrescine oxidoreductase [Roseivivax sp. THAF40]